MIARFPGNYSEHPASSGWVMKTIQDITAYTAIFSSVEEIVPHKEIGTPITCLRNRTVGCAIAAQCDYLLMIDSDMDPDVVPGAPEFWATAWTFMMNRRKREREWCGIGGLEFNFEDYWYHFAPATIAAPYCGASPAQPVLMLQWSANNGDGHPDKLMKLGLIDRYDAAARTGIGKVAAMGTGLILYDTRVFFYLPPPWFDYEYTDVYRIERSSTEDVFQTRNADFLGMPQFCAWDCWSGHWKLELISKPNPLTSEIVNDNIREAIKRGFSSSKKLHFVNQDAMKHFDFNATT